MDDVPYEIDVKGVKGKRTGNARYYAGKHNSPSGWVLDVTYRFDLKELQAAGAAKQYRLSEQKEASG